MSVLRGGNHWGVGTANGDGVLDLMDDLFTAARQKRPIVDWRQAIDPLNAKHDMALVRRAAALVVQPVIRVGSKALSRPQLLDTAGAVLIFLEHNVKVPRLALRLAEVALERELLREVLANWKPGRNAKVRAELRRVRSLATKK